MPGYPGPAEVCAAPGRECRVLTAGELVPIGAYLDTSKGAVSLETRRADGTPARMTVYGGVLQLQQGGAPNAILVARMAGGDFTAACRRAGSRTIGAALRATLRKVRPLARKTVRKLWGEGEGRFRSTGRHGGATVRGTRFLVTDRCDGTLVRVTRGKVDVRDRRRGRTVRVRAPSSYLVRGPRGQRSRG